MLYQGQFLGVFGEASIDEHPATITSHFSQARGKYSWKINRISKAVWALQLRAIIIIILMVTEIYIGKRNIRMTKNRLEKLASLSRP